MAPVHRRQPCAASPSAIWKTCLEHMDWSVWDPDVKAVENISGPCQDGATCTLVMNDGMKAHTVLSNVVKERSVTFSGKFFGGLARFKGEMVISPHDTAEDMATIDYTFEISGWVGGLVNMFKMDAIVQGTEGGVANIVRLSEEAAAASSK